MFTARFIDSKGIKKTRTYPANHLVHAQHKALGIARYHGWTVVSVGRTA